MNSIHDRLEEVRLVAKDDALLQLTMMMMMMMSKLKSQSVVVMMMWSVAVAVAMQAMGLLLVERRIYKTQELSK